MNQEIIKKILAFRDERNWRQFHTGEHLAKALTIEAAELLECFIWENEAKDLNHLQEELADVLIYAILIAENYSFNIEEIILKKLKINEQKYPLKKT